MCDDHHFSRCFHPPCLWQRGTPGTWRSCWWSQSSSRSGRQGWPSPGEITITTKSNSLISLILSLLKSRTFCALPRWWSREDLSAPTSRRSISFSCLKLWLLPKYHSCSKGRKIYLKKMLLLIFVYSSLKFFSFLKLIPNTSLCPFQLPTDRPLFEPGEEKKINAWKR